MFFLIAQSNEKTYLNYFHLQDKHVTLSYEYYEKSKKKFWYDFLDLCIPKAVIAFDIRHIHTPNYTISEDLQAKLHLNFDKFLLLFSSYQKRLHEVNFLIKKNSMYLKMLTNYNKLSLNKIYCIYLINKIRLLNELFDIHIKSKDIATNIQILNEIKHSILDAKNNLLNIQTNNSMLNSEIESMNTIKIKNQEFIIPQINLQYYAKKFKNKCLSIEKIKLEMKIMSKIKTYFETSSAINQNFSINHWNFTKQDLIAKTSFTARHDGKSNISAIIYKNLEIRQKTIEGLHKMKSSVNNIQDLNELITNLLNSLSNYTIIINHSMKQENNLSENILKSITDFFQHIEEILNLIDQLHKNIETLIEQCGMNILLKAPVQTVNFDEILEKILIDCKFAQN